MTEPSKIESVAELLAHAHAMESEASERYAELAEQMEVHHNLEVAALFRKMAEVEQAHVAKVLARAGDTKLPHIPPWEYKWASSESPQSAAVIDAHYMMRPFHALSMALQAEKRALAFYQEVADNAGDPGIVGLARELLEDEKQHVALMEEWLAKHPEPEDDWDEDLDPPNLQE